LYRTEDGTVWSTCLRWTVDFGGVDPVIDPFPLALWLNQIPRLDDSRAYIRGVRFVERGSFVHRAPAGTVREAAYWDPRPGRLRPPTAARFREHAERLRTLLLDSLRADLDPAGGNLLSLSGGIDSTALLCLARGTLGIPVSALTFLPVEDDQRELELEHLRSATDRAPLERHRTVLLSQAHFLEIAERAAPVGFPVLHPVLHTLRTVAAEWPVRVLFGGEFGDEIGGSRFALQDWANHTPFWKLLRPSRLPTSAMDWAKLRARDVIRGPADWWPESLREWVEPGLREEYLDWRATAIRLARSDRRPLRRLALRTRRDDFLAMNWEACSEVGVRRLTPFFSRAALELAFDCHPGELIGPGYRRLVRAALSEDVPARNLFREDPGFWGPGPPGPERAPSFRAQLAGVLDPEWDGSSDPSEDLTWAILAGGARFEASIGASGRASRAKRGFGSP
jgi:asparagine synthetase B (glutamine-hydrolysing)